MLEITSGLSSAPWSLAAANHFWIMYFKGLNNIWGFLKAFLLVWTAEMSSNAPQHYLLIHIPLPSNSRCYLHYTFAFVLPRSLTIKARFRAKNTCSHINFSFFYPLQGLNDRASRHARRGIIIPEDKNAIINWLGGGELDENHSWIFFLPIN